jgi:ketosteroid isomerase-like protein
MRVFHLPTARATRVHQCRFIVLRSADLLRTAVRAHLGLLGEPRRIVLEEHACDELAACAHADLLEDGLQMVLDRPRRDVQRAADGLGREAVRDELDDRALSLREPVRVRDQRREVVRASRVERDGSPGVAVAAERRSANDEPGAGVGAHASAGQPRLSAVPGAARPARHGGDDVREWGMQIAGRELREPRLARRVGQHDRVVAAEQDQPGLALVVMAARGQRREQGRAPLAAAMNAGDLETFVALHEQNATTIAPPEGRAVSGRAEIRAALEPIFASGPKLANEVVGTLEGDGLALTHARWKLKGRDPDGRAIEVAGRGTIVSRRQPEGAG